MSGYDIERLARLIGMLPPAPRGWVRAAQELPTARQGLDELVARAAAAVAYRRTILADLEAALLAEGFEPDRRVLDELRRRLADV
jgi:hypothetical protein